jgi:hypothetical protein
MDASKPGTPIDHGRAIRGCIIIILRTTWDDMRSRNPLLTEESKNVFLITTALPSMLTIEGLGNIQETCSPYLGDHFLAYISGEPSRQNSLASRPVSVGG